MERSSGRVEDAPHYGRERLPTAGYRRKFEPSDAGNRREAARNGTDVAQLEATFFQGIHDMSMRFRRMHRIVATVLFTALTGMVMAQQEAPRPFGGAYSELDQRRQRLVDDWVARFVKVTGHHVDARSFYDEVLPLSTKTTFEAVTNALMTTPLTDTSGRTFGDALTLIERIDTVKGEVPGTKGDRQFRIYARLTPDAREMLGRSQEFKRAADNSVYRKGYPLNYREQGTPSIQVSMALDGRLADILSRSNTERPSA
jgi:hypothetical protein